MRYPHRASASKAELLAACQFWARRDVQPDPYDPSQPAAIGNAVHACAGAIVRGEEPDVLAACDRENVEPENVETVLAMVDAVREWWPAFTAAHPFAWRSEVAYSLRAGDLGTEAIALGLDIGRRYRDHGAKPGDFTMSLDLEAVDGDTVLVVDLKTGRKPHHPEGHKQLESNALAACLAHGKRRARVGIATVSTRGVWVEWADVDAATLAHTDDEIARLLAAVPNAEPQPGPHCSALYCNAKGACPASAQAVAAIVPAARLALGPVSSADEARAWLAALPLIEAACAAQKAHARNWIEANGGELDLGNGKVLRKATTTRESIEARPDVLAALSRELGENVALATKTTVSKAGIERAVAAMVSGRGRSARVREVLGTIEALGAVKLSTFENWKEEER